MDDSPANTPERQQDEPAAEASVTGAIARQEQRLLALSGRDMDALLAAIAAPPPPNAAMRRSVTRWRKLLPPPIRP